MQLRPVKFYFTNSKKWIKFSLLLALFVQPLMFFANCRGTSHATAAQLITVSGSVNASDIVGTSISIFSPHQAQSPIDSSGSFTVILSAQATLRLSQIQAFSSFSPFLLYMRSQLTTASSSDLRKEATVNAALSVRTNGLQNMLPYLSHTHERYRLEQDLLDSHNCS